MSHRRRLITAVLGVLVMLPVVAVHADDRGVSRDPWRRAASLVAEMTLDEKITELHGMRDAHHQRFVPGIPRLGIPPFVITNGPAGVGPGDATPQPPATALPAPIGLAATWDRRAAGVYGGVQGDETRDLAESLIEAPDINMARVPQNGRTFEGYGEDPFLAGELSVANIQAIQRRGVIAEVKHYAANNQESSRFTINEVIDDRTLHEIYLPHFEAAVTRGHAGSVMCAYPRIDGTFSCENPALIDDVLRGQWGFDGFVQSDFGAAHSTVPSAQAGMDLEMPTGIFYGAPMQQAVATGQVSVAAIDTLLIRRFATMIRFGLFDRPLTTSPIPAQADGAVARQVGEQSVVLLRNEAAQLPLDAGQLHSIAVIGPGSVAAMTGGGGSSHVAPLYTVGPVDGIRNRVGPGVAVSTADGADVAKAAATAAAADVAVVMVGDSEREGRDRTTLSLGGGQDQLVEAAAAANRHTVVVVKSGGPVLMPWAASVPAIVEAWYPGEEDGNVVAAVLFGDVNPSGKLPITFPASEAQTPASTPEQWPGVGGTAVYSEKLEVGYRHYDAQGLDPLFPFGYGLSYTTFRFHDLRVTGPDHEGAVHVHADVTNTGSRAGAEVAQVYVGDPASTGEPPHQLRGFQKVLLRPGQTGHVEFTLDRRAFSTWDSQAQAWFAADGVYQVLVGDSSRSLPLRGSVRLARAEGPQAVSVSAPAAFVPGSASPVSVLLTNLGDDAVHEVRVSLRVPEGWRRDGGEQRFATVAPHASVRATWRVRPPADAEPSAATLSGTASWEGPGGEDRHAASGQRSATVAFASAGEAANDVGVTDDASPAAGAFAADGSTYSAQALAAAGLTPGVEVVHQGVAFTWPAAGSGSPDNVQADGQVVAVSGAGGRLAFLGASTGGPRGGVGTLYYQDGSSEPFTVTLPDWSKPGPGDDVVATIPGVNAPTGPVARPVSVFFVAVPLAPGRSLAAVALPDTGAAPEAGMHVFAMAVG